MLRSETISEIAGIRPFNADSPADVDRLHTIFRLLPSEFSNIWNLTKEDIVEEIAITRPEEAVPRKATYYAVTGNEYNLPPEETDQVQGWISIEPDSNANKLKSLGVLPEHRDALEIVYARYPDSPVRRHIASGVRQVCSRIGEMYSQSQALSDLLITAYVLGRNTASQHLLLSSGFRNWGESNLWLGQNRYQAYALDWNLLTVKS